MPFCFTSVSDGKKVKIPLTLQRYNIFLDYANKIGKNIQNVRKNLHICKKSSNFAAYYVHKLI